jgi:hypothetical protein
VDIQPRRRDSGASVTRSAATALAAPKPGPSATVGVLTPARATGPDSVGPDSVGPDSVELDPVERVTAVSVVVGVSTLVRSLPAVRVAVLRSVVGVSAAVAEAVGVAAVVAAVEAVVSVGVAVAVPVGVAVESLPAEPPLPPPVSPSDTPPGGGSSVSSAPARESQSRMWTSFERSRMT